MKWKEFKLANLAIENRTTMYVVTVLLVLFGISQYQNTPKEEMPEIDIPFFMINTIYPGTSPTDMENLITQELEKEIKSIEGIDELTSKSLQDFSSVFVKFEVEVNKTKAYLDLRKAIDDAQVNLPSDMPDEPELIQIEITELPILNINLSGDLGLPRLKDYAEDLQDRIEQLTEVNRADIVGDLEREIQINVDLYKMQAAGISFQNIENAIATENLTMTGGHIDMDGLKKNMRIVGEFSQVKQVGDILLKKGLYIRDIAEVTDGFEERESYARLNGMDVISLNVIKKGGENLIDAIDKIHVLLEDFESEASEGLVITTTGDSSKRTRDSVSNLFNTIVLGFLVVVLVLMFFMGIDNAIFAGTAIPLSILVAFILVPQVGFTMNNVVLMGFILVLGMLVDNSIVVVENIYRHFTTTPDLPIVPATKRALGEVALPVLTGTLTTIAPFFPLMFWPGIMGEFFIHVPVVVIITLAASILVAYLQNPVFAVSFMKYRDPLAPVKKSKYLLVGSVLAIVVAAICFYLKFNLVANILSIATALYLLGVFVLVPLIRKFQRRVVPAMIQVYKRLLTAALRGHRPQAILAAGAILLVVTLVLFAKNPPNVVLFPQGDPDELYVYLTMPEGTHIEKTDSVARVVEQKVFQVLGENNPDVESVMTNVAKNAGSGHFDRSVQDKLARITIYFVDYRDRVTDRSTTDYLNDLRAQVKGIPEAKILIDKKQQGPPVDKPVNIEISGEDLQGLIALSVQIEKFINEQQIPGIEGLESDMDLNKPEIVVSINRDKANEMELSTAQVASNLRTALYGKEVSRFRDGEDAYPIQLRLDKAYRNDVDVLLSQQIIVKGKGGNPDRHIPLSTVVSVEEVSTFGGVSRIDNERVITLSSNVIEGYNANQVVASVQRSMGGFQVPDGFKVNFTGEQEQQKESADFLMWALMMAVALIIAILIAQFNSIGKPLIIFTMILFSFIGIFLGIIIFHVDFSIIMSGLGIISVGGMVATNGIILIQYTDERVALGGDRRTAIINAGATRLVPVLLTALSTVLGLLPLAIGVNIDLVGLLTSLQPDIYFGGPTAKFWNPLAWTIIFGLSFSTLLTLIVEPAMYYVIYGRKK